MDPPVLSIIVNPAVDSFHFTYVNTDEDEVVAVITDYSGSSKAQLCQCLVCWESITEADVKLVEKADLNLFGELCLALKCAPSIFVSETSKDISNSNFCKGCFTTLMKSVELHHQMRKIEEQLEGISSLLKRSIVSSYKSTRSFKCEGPNPVVEFRKAFMDCYGTDSDSNSQIIEETEILPPSPEPEVHVVKSVTKTRPKRARKKPNKYVNVEFDQAPSPLSPSIEIDDSDVNLIEHTVEEDSSHKERSKEVTEEHGVDDSIVKDVADSTQAEEPPLKKRRMRGRSKKKSDLEGPEVTQKQSRPKLYTCPEPNCNQGYQTRYLYVAHLKTHAGDLPLICEHCGKQFASQSQLGCHKRSIKVNIQKALDREKKINPPEEAPPILKDCSFCGLSFTEESSPNTNPRKLAKLRRDHINSCPENPKVKYKSAMESDTLKCGQCDKTFLNLASLLSHIATIHEKSFKHSCETCGKGFHVAGMLNRHIQFVHSEERRFKCDICNLTFRRKHQLFYHNRRHTGELPFICEFCGKGFHVQEKLRNHVTTHSVAKPFPCSECGKRFSCKQYVTNHVNSTHRGNRRSRPSKPSSKTKVEETEKDTLEKEVSEPGQAAAATASIPESDTPNKASDPTEPLQSDLSPGNKQLELQSTPTLVAVNSQADPSAGAQTEPKRTKKSRKQNPTLKSSEGRPESEIVIQAVELSELPDGDPNFIFDGRNYILEYNV